MRIVDLTRLCKLLVFAFYFNNNNITKTQLVLSYS